MIIYLNGTSSSGKSTIIQAFLHYYHKPIVNVSVDLFTSNMSNKFFGFGDKADLGYKFIQKKDKNGLLTSVKSGPLSKTLVKLMDTVILSVAKEGIDVIVDNVCTTDEELLKVKKMLKKHHPLFVKVDCPLSVLHDRELVRGNRARGLARHQFQEMAKMKFPFDLRIDTQTTTPLDAAKLILKHIGCKI